MKVICAWCGRGIGEKWPYNDNSISHGMCRECAKEISEKEGLDYDDKNDRQKNSSSF